MFRRRERELEARIVQLEAEQRAGRMQQVVAQRVCVVLKSGRSIAGALIACHADSISLGGARLLAEASASATALDGEVVIPNASIDFIQAGIEVNDTRELVAVAGGRA
jgi:hypothetical protein